MNHTILYSNNRKISLYLWENQSYSKPVAIIQIVHGFFDHASRYDEFAQFLIRHGFVVVAHDLNGHGYTSSLYLSPEVSSSTSNITTTSLSSSKNSCTESVKSSTNPNYYPNSFDLKQHHKEAKVPPPPPPPIIDNDDDSMQLNQKSKRKSKDVLKEEPKVYDNHDPEKMPMPMPMPLQVPDYYPPKTTISPSISNSSNPGNYNYYSNMNRKNHDIGKQENDDELPPYSTYIHHLGFEEGNMFQNDIMDILAVSSYCREKFLHIPLILLGIGYGSYLAQYFIEHNKYRKTRKDASSTFRYTSDNNHHSHHHHHHHKRKYSLKNKEKKKKGDDSLIQRHSLIDPTIDGFILCGTNYRMTLY